MNLHWKGSASRLSAVIQHIWKSVLDKMTLFYSSVLIKTIKVSPGTRHEAASELLNLTFSAIKDSHMHVEECKENDCQDLLHQMKHQVKDNKDNIN